MPVPLVMLRANVQLPQQRTRGKTSTPSKVGQPRGLAGSAGKENRHAHTPATPASSATPGSARRRMLKEDLVELLSTARLSDLQAELKAISPARSDIHVFMSCPADHALPALLSGLPKSVLLPHQLTSVVTVCSLGSRSVGGVTPPSDVRRVAARGTDVHVPLSACVATIGGLIVSNGAQQHSAERYTPPLGAMTPPVERLVAPSHLFLCSPALTGTPPSPHSLCNTRQQSRDDSRNTPRLLSLGASLGATPVDTPVDTQHQHQRKHAHQHERDMAAMADKCTQRG